jgi:hypothetical protein
VDPLRVPRAGHPLGQPLEHRLTRDATAPKPRATPAPVLPRDRCSLPRRRATRLRAPGRV